MGKKWEISCNNSYTVFHWTKMIVKNKWSQNREILKISHNMNEMFTTATGWVTNSICLKCHYLSACESSLHYKGIKTGNSRFLNFGLTFCITACTSLHDYILHEQETTEVGFYIHICSFNTCSTTSFIIPNTWGLSSF